MILIKEGSAEWEYMWEWLSAHPINEGQEKPYEAENPLNGEKWQYCGSFRQDQRIIHEMRHRSHPSDNERHILKLHASDNISGEDIGKELSIKN